MNDILGLVLYHNTVLQYLIFLALLLVSILVVNIATKMLVKRLKPRAEKSKKPVDELLVNAAEQYLSPILTFTAIILCLKTLAISQVVQNIVDAAVKIFFAFVGGLLLTRVSVSFLNRYWKQKRRGAGGKMTVHWMSVLMKFSIWTVVGILFLQNIGVKIDALLAGLGVGGLAIAFAAQTVLEDVFCFVTIFFDRPFEIGDFIISGDHMGTVEHIGVRSTRLRSLDGEQLILSNKDLTSSRIRNYKTMKKRRVVFPLGVTYQTDAELLAEIPALLRQIIEGVGGAEFGRAHFFTFGDYSLDYEVVFFVLSDDYDQYMDTRQKINLKIKEVFDLRGIKFAFPTQTLFLDGGDPKASQRAKH
ncbi:MAG: mechanosensitive ion channel family protein [Eubacteriales bacterium]|nr:mechanosensitive ion channel family protein [Eubacteriales bacterium]